MKTKCLKCINSLNINNKIQSYNFHNYYIYKIWILDIKTHVTNSITKIIIPTGKASHSIENRPQSHTKDRQGKICSNNYKRTNSIKEFTSKAFQSRTVVSNEDIASLVEFGLKRTSVIIRLCSSGVLCVCSVSMFHRTT